MSTLATLIRKTEVGLKLRASGVLNVSPLLKKGHRRILTMEHAYHRRKYIAVAIGLALLAAIVVTERPEQPQESLTQPADLSARLDPKPPESIDAHNIEPKQKVDHASVAHAVQGFLKPDATEKTEREEALPLAPPVPGEVGLRSLENLGVTDDLVAVFLDRLPALQASVSLAAQLDHEYFKSSGEYYAQANEALLMEDEARAAVGDKNFEILLHASGLPNRLVVSERNDDIGLQAGDVVVSFANEKVFSLQGLYRDTDLDNLRGDAELKVKRGKSELTLSVRRKLEGLVTSTQSVSYGRSDAEWDSGNDEQTLASPFDVNGLPKATR